MRESEEKYTNGGDGYFQKAGKWFPVYRTLMTIKEWLKTDNAQRAVHNLLNPSTPTAAHTSTHTSTHTAAPTPTPTPTPTPSDDNNGNGHTVANGTQKWGMKEYGLASSAVGLGAAGLYYALSKNKRKRRSKSKSRSKRRSKSKSRSKRRSKSKSSE